VQPAPSLAHFIEDHRAAIVAEWERRVRAGEHPEAVPLKPQLGALVGELAAVLANPPVGTPAWPIERMELGAVTSGCALLRDCTLRLLAASGSPVDLEEVANFSQIMDGLLLSVGAAHRARQSRLAEGGARLSESFAAAIDCIVVIDARSLVLEWNPAAEDTFGIRRDEAIGRPLAELIIPPELREAHREGLARHLATGQGRFIGRRVEIEALRVDGSRIPVELAITAGTAGGQPSYVGFMRDISARRNAEREREQLIGVLSHDLRTPLTAVAVSAGTLLRGDKLAENHRKAAMRVVSSAERMRRMINDLLDVTQSRLGGGLHIHRSPTDVVAVARQVLEEMKVVHPNRAVQLEASEACEGQFDSDRIAQVLNNLVSNALTHGAPEGTVEVKLRCEGPELLVQVANEGPALADELLPVLWEPFRRGRAAEEGKKSGGLGLGLYIVHEIARAHGGRAEVSSADGKTTFAVRLPREPPAS